MSDSMSITIRSWAVCSSMPTTGSATFNSSMLLSEALQLVPIQFSGGFIELAVLFFVLAIIAAVVGASGVAGISMSIAKWFVIIFIVLAIISAIL